MPIGAGSRIGPYEITALIGEGGMGKVWRAHHTALKRDDALKVLPEAVASDADRLARFQREAQVLASLNHPNIAHVYGLERTESGHALVMELVEGPTLADRIAAGPVPVDEALPYARQIAEALEAAHEQGIVHRDLKPANIKLRPDGVVKVLDFGLAKALQPSSAGHADVTASPTITSPAMMTNAGVILGTAAYMSPEQARGKAVDKRTDIWAFGCVLYEMLTGRRAFGGDEVSDVLASVLAREPDWTLLPRGLPPVLVAFIKRCLHKDRKQRIGDAQSVRLALEGAFETSGLPAADSTHRASAWRRALPAVAAALATAVLVGAVAWALRPATDASRITRFDYVLPEGQQFRGASRPVMAISPDGRHFVYNTFGGLYLRTMGEIEPRLIPGTEDVLIAPFFSPDGQSLAYVQNNQLKRISVSGGTPSIICAATAPFGASWTTNNQILFGQPSGIMRVSATGGTPELVIAAKDGEEVYGPQLLPDGDAVLFSVTTGTGAARWDEGRVVVQSMSSGERTVVVHGGGDARYVPSGHVVYALQGGLFAVPFDARRLTVTGAAVPLAQAVQRSAGLSVTAAAHYGVSDEGTLVYVPDSAALRSFVWVNRLGASAGPIASIPPAAYDAPRLSPDGARVGTARDGDIWIYDVVSGRSSRLTRERVNVMPVWDPAGLQIAYSSGTGATSEAWVARSDGSGEPRQLTQLGGQVHVDSWSPDGGTLAIHHHPQRPGAPVSMQMVAMEGANAKPQFFLSRGFSNEAATFSPDSRYVAYVSGETGQTEVYIRPYPGPGGQETVSIGGGREPVWTKNGELFYRSLTGERMMAVAVTTQPTLKIGRPVQLFEGPYFISPTGSLRPQYDVTADGQRFLMLAASSGADASGSAPASLGSSVAGARPRLVVVQNWHEELERLAPVR
jgi:Tol biopolymer transport system component